MYRSDTGLGDHMRSHLPRDQLPFHCACCDFKAKRGHKMILHIAARHKEMSEKDRLLSLRNLNDGRRKTKVKSDNSKASQASDNNNAAQASKKREILGPLSHEQSPPSKRSKVLQVSLIHYFSCIPTV